MAGDGHNRSEPAVSMETGRHNSVPTSVFGQHPMPVTSAWGSASCPDPAPTATAARQGFDS